MHPVLAGLVGGIIAAFLYYASIREFLKDYCSAKVRSRFQKQRTELENKSADFRAELLAKGKKSVKENPYEDQIKNQLSSEMEEKATEVLMDKWDCVGWAFIILGMLIFAIVAACH